MHPAAGDCCCAKPVSDCCSDCCGEQDAGGHAPDCCVDGGKMLPDALLPVMDRMASTAAFVVSQAPAMPVVVEFRPWAADSCVTLLRAPPPRRATFLVHRSLRL